MWLDFFGPQPLPDVVIETGTHHGAGAFRWSKLVDHVHTIELGEDLHLSSKEKYKDVSNITFHHGSSAEVLREILPSIDERLIIFLDAHGSGGDTVFDDSVGRFGSPLLGELKAIKECSPRNDHVIIIDDTDDLNTLNYPTTQEIEAALLDINPDYHIELHPQKMLLMSRGTGIAVVLNNSDD